MTFTPEDVKRVTKEIVAEYGEDYVYPGAGNASCFYVNEDGSPSCLLGHIAFRLDPDLFNGLAEAERDDGCDDSDTGLFESALVGVGALNMLGAMFRAQGEQDCGQPWGVAAKAILEEQI